MSLKRASVKAFLLENKCHNHHYAIRSPSKSSDEPTKYDLAAVPNLNLYLGSPLEALCSHHTGHIVRI